MKNKPIQAMEVPPRTLKSIYPEPFAKRMENRTKRQLGNFFGLEKFGVNLTQLDPHGESALLHRHSKQEEFIFIVSGHPTLVTDTEEFQLSPGMCAGFPPNGTAHMLVNKTSSPVLYLEVGDREVGDTVDYPKDDMIAEMSPAGTWLFKHKDGKLY